MTDDTGYVLPTDDRERARLRHQSAWLAAQTHALFTEAGIGAGQHVLDVGSGAGDVAFLAAGLVGPEGRVLGLDRDASQVAAANARAADLGHDTVRFETADLFAFDTTDRFDAVVGRFVLIHTARLDDALDRLARLVRPGGVMAFLELQYDGGWTTISDPEDLLPASFRRIGDLLLRTVEASAGARNLVVRLPRSLARLGAVESRLDQRAAIGREVLRAYCAHVIDTARAALPGMVALGVASEGEVDLAAIEAEVDAALARPEAETAVTDGYPAVLSFVRLP